ncbi:MAG: NAD(+) synthase [Clostridia bacterium]|nr:NAD(+) synthase [Clostridia bacterium]
MNYGFLKVGCVNIGLNICDCEHNTNEIISKIDMAYKEQIKLLVFPELVISGCTCQDLFFQKTLLDGVLTSLLKITKSTHNKDMIVVLGLPLVNDQKLYNCAAVISQGKILGIVPKSNLTYDEMRYFSKPYDLPDKISFGNYDIPFSENLIFSCQSMSNFKFGVLFETQDINSFLISSNYILNGANIIVSLGGLADFSDSLSKRKTTLKEQSSQLHCGYIFANTGLGESSTDKVFAGQNIIAENGEILALSEPFNPCITSSCFDLDLLEAFKLKTPSKTPLYKCTKIEFNLNLDKISSIDRKITPAPFIPTDLNRADYFEQILMFQCEGLKKRIKHINAKKLIIGISGGLDSTLALLVCVRTIKQLNLDSSDIIAVTMPCFGTSSRTYKNANTLCEHLGVTVKEIPVKDEVLLHFKDIDQDINNHDATYENAQARIRTLILMDLANKHSGIVIGTGDLSEIALGFCTYNGDHMSMYSVNSSLPKTLIQDIVAYVSTVCEDTLLKNTLNDIVATPISPELLPSDNANLLQKTEDIIGPYELHDFFLYYIYSYGFTPEKIFKLAKLAFSDKYTTKTICKWLCVFYKRFFASQFKRSCSPDAVKSSSISLSPRGGLYMPSDAVCKLWLDQIDKIKNF